VSHQYVSHQANFSRVKEHNITCGHWSRPKKSHAATKHTAASSHCPTALVIYNIKGLQTIAAVHHLLSNLSKKNDTVVKGYVVALLAQLCCGVHN
jgi:hypothetical protein